MKPYQYAVSIGLGVLIILGGFFLLLTPAGNTVPQATTKPEAAKVTYVNASADLIKVALPYPGAVTGKAFSVTGTARGQWFFEGSFPVTVLDKEGKELATGIAQADGEWMTTEFVPFKADIQVPESYIGPATLVLKKDNPSGEPERDASVTFPFVIEY